MKKTDIFIDTDCGIDDAVAIMLALASPEVSVKGISCVAGNTGIDNVVNNVCGLLNFLGRDDIPVYRGCSAALTGGSLRADEVHGSGGLGGVDLPAGGKTAERLGAAAGLRLAAETSPDMVLVTLGPLTNAAVALNLYPELATLIGGSVVMGGALGRGNVTEYAEFNFACDPEAVYFFLNTGIETRILSWDAVIDMTFTEEEYNELGMAGTPSGDLFIDIQRFYMDYKEKVYGKRIITFPDPLAMACVINPGLAVSVRNTALDIVLNHDDKRRGASVAGTAGSVGKTHEVITGCSREGFTSMIKRIKDMK